MPLREGSSEEVISANIAELIRAGHEEKQAAAIAYKKAGKARDRLFYAQDAFFATADRNAFHTPTELGKTRKLTPEGYLVCEGVAIARTGEQQYNKSEIPLEADPQGIVTVTRTPEEVFHPTTIASFEGKSVTVEHPNEFLTPKNYKQFEVGTVHNVRRGEGIEDDMLVADLLIKDPAAVAHVNRDKPQVSCGYDSGYEQDMPGHAFQRGIVGNHLALVDRGRAGPRCAIRDHLPPATFTFPSGGFFTMADKTPSLKARFTDRMARIRAAFIAKDAAAMEKELGTQDGESEVEGETHTGDGVTDKQVEDALDRIMARRTAKDAEETERKRKECEDKAIADAAAAKAKDTILSAEGDGQHPNVEGVVLKVGDHALTEDGLKTVLGRAEILCPGIAVPTADAVKVKDAIPNLMLSALRQSFKTEAGKAAITPFLLGAATVDTLTVDTVMGVFNGSAELMRIHNNGKAALSGKITARTGDGSKPSSAKAINDANKAFWAGRGQ